MFGLDNDRYRMDAVAATKTYHERQKNIGERYAGPLGRRGTALGSVLEACSNGVQQFPMSVPASWGVK